MTSSARDVRYGRRGGGWADKPTATGCVTCGAACPTVYCGTCNEQRTAEISDDQLDLFAQEP